MNKPEILVPEELIASCAGRKALVTGVYGQDGSYMVDYLLELGYTVFGAHRPSMTRDDENLRHVLDHPRLTLVEMDITDPTRVNSVISRVLPHEIYNFAALSRVGPSFEAPASYFLTNAMAVTYIVSAIEHFCPNTKLYQASTSEMWGTAPAPQGYDTPFQPDSPYAVAKLAAHWFCINERRRGLYLACGIMNNHESGPRRGRYFVTRKIIDGLRAIKRNIDEKRHFEPLHLGNLLAKRDFGYSPEFVAGAWALLQQPEPLTAVFGTGKSITVEEFLLEAARALGFGVPGSVEGHPGKAGWKLRDYAGHVIALCDPEFFRPMDPNELCASQEALETTKELIGWEPFVRGAQVIKKMVEDPEKVTFFSVRG